MSNHFVQVCFINIKWNQLCDTMFFSKTRWYFDSPLQCPLPRGDNRWLLHPRVSDWLWWLLYWLMRFFFFFFPLPLFFKGFLSWMIAAAASLIDLTVFQGFSTNPQCALQQSPHHLSWGPKPQKLIYRSIIVFGRRRGLTGVDQCGSQALWITICPLNSKSMTQRA